MMLHPRFLPKQVSLEIRTSMEAFPVMTVLTLPWFLGEVRGWSKIYHNVDDHWGGWWYLVASVPCYLLFTDYCIYWIHRWLHHPLLYKPLHKPHHKWISKLCSLRYLLILIFCHSPYSVRLARIPSCRWISAIRAIPSVHLPLPNASSALPCSLCCSELLEYLCTSSFVLILASAHEWYYIQIHDSDMITGHPLENVINGPAHHTLHHLYFTVNYGQYFTWADRVGKSYRHPDASLDPLLEVKMRDRAEKEGKTKTKSDWDYALIVVSRSCITWIQ